MIRDHGFIHQFPWLQETTWRDRYVDVHLGYHVLLIPFVTFFDPVVGMKVSAVLFGLAAFYAIYRLLRSIESPFPELLTLAGAFSFEFLHRMSMPRAPSISLALLLFGTWAMLRNKPRTTFVIAVAFVWLYHGWPVLVAAYGCIAIGSVLANQKISWKSILPTVRVGFALLLGIAVGYVANPYFPDNVAVVIPNILNIGIRGSAPIAVGAEWSSSNPLYLAISNLPAAYAAVVSLAVLIVAIRKREIDRSEIRLRAAWSLSLAAMLFGAFSVRSIRYVEYLVPFLLASSGAMMSVALPYATREWGAFARGAVWERLWRRRTVALAAAVVFLAFLGTRAVRFSVNDARSFSVAQFEGSARWLKENLEPGRIAFNSRWEDSMAYFYLDDEHYQLVGLDPRLMYDQDADRYAIWERIASGDESDISKIQTVFHAEAVVVDARSVGLDRILAASDTHRQAYADAWKKIYVSIPAL